MKILGKRLDKVKILSYNQHMNEEQIELLGLIQDINLRIFEFRGRLGSRLQGGSAAVHGLEKAADDFVLRAIASVLNKVPDSRSKPWEPKDED